MTIPIEHHLKSILEQNSEHLKINTNPSFICDVHDSANFQRLRTKMENNPCVTITAYTDGAAKFKATKEKSVWPITFIINEIVLEYRFKRQNILCAAISFGKTPNMEMFFKPLVDEINAIN